MVGTEASVSGKESCANWESKSRSSGVGSPADEWGRLLPLENLGLKGQVERKVADCPAHLDAICGPSPCEWIFALSSFLR